MLDQIYKYQDRVTKLEKLYVKQANSLVDKTRQEIWNGIKGGTITTSQQVSSKFSELKSEMVDLSRETSRTLNKMIRDFVDLQGQYYSHYIDIPSTDEIISINESSVFMILNLMLIRTPISINTLENSVLQELNVMWVKGSSQRDIYERIFGDGGSLFSKYKHSLRLELQRYLWDVNNTILQKHYSVIESRLDGYKVWKVALATIDNDTTDCCLRVHGQAQYLTDNFRLTGSPAFSASLPNPPFHWNCRTIVVIVIEGISDWYKPNELKAKAAAQRLKNKSNRGKIT